MIFRNPPQSRLSRLGGIALKALVLSCAFTLPLSAATFTVGEDPALCDFVDLQQALDFARHRDTVEVQVGDYSGPFRIAEKGLSVRGGFDSCGGEQVGRSRLLGHDRVRVLEVSSLQQEVAVYLFDFEVSGGNQTVEVDGNEGGGIAIYGGVALHFRRGELSGNKAHRGGGISARHAAGLSPAILFSDSVVAKNHALEHPLHALNHGGAIYYDGLWENLVESQFGNMIWLGQTDVIQNSAWGSGGGVAATAGRIWVYKGSSDSFAVSANSAGLDGGAMAVKNSVVDIFGSFLSPSKIEVELRHNRAGRDGGAIFMENSTLELDAAEVSDNRAERDGGAIAAVEGSHLKIGQELRDCQEGKGCQRFDRNTSGAFGGAISLESSSAWILAARGNHNQAGSGAAFLDASSQSSDLRLWSVALSANKADFLIAARKTKSLDIRSSTFHGNEITWAPILSFQTTDEPIVSQSIFWKNGGLAYLLGGQADFACNLVEDMALVPVNERLTREGNPNLQAGTFRLHPFVSPALDMCQVLGSPAAPVDIDYMQRPADFFLDVGADEH